MITEPVRQRLKEAMNIAVFTGAGADIRYCGFWSRMDAVCNQYDHYQRVSLGDLCLEDPVLQLRRLGD